MSGRFDANFELQPIKSIADVRLIQPGDTLMVRAEAAPVRTPLYATVDRVIKQPTKLNPSGELVTALALSVYPLGEHITAARDLIRGGDGALQYEGRVVYTGPKDSLVEHKPMVYPDGIECADIGEYKVNPVDNRTYLRHPNR